ncbi:unnamed protein product [Effrenium voratum]|uniref:Uncharacterized protein n=1 Tax=Effrenium voratum TaxID=2562239 RepID=A0AA36MQC9_9DINO|nr:unnamed protein product [Effrenium voratum]
MDLLASENGKDGSKNEAGSHTHEQMKAQTAMRAELIQTMHDLRAERGRMDSAMKQRQAILDAIEHCEKTRIDVRQQLRKNAHKMAQEMQEEHLRLSQVPLQQLLPGTWQAQLEEDWQEARIRRAVRADPFRRPASRERPCHQPRKCCA